MEDMISIFQVYGVFFLAFKKLWQTARLPRKKLQNATNTFSDSVFQKMSGLDSSFDQRIKRLKKEA